MTDQKLMLITGDRKGIGRYLVEYYIKKNYRIIGCSRNQVDFEYENLEQLNYTIYNKENTN